MAQGQNSLLNELNVLAEAGRQVWPELWAQGLKNDGIATGVSRNLVILLLALVGAE